ncbi:MAG TPA: HAD family hydrolase [Polyangiaceae bacterium]|nr:HAD family hydrolase [Polyangiaceae bacterium]
MNALKDEDYEAWLVDLDGTLYWAPGVKLAMGLELALFGLSKIKRLRRFRHEHEALRAAGPAAALGDPFQLQLQSAAHALELEPAILEQDIRSWMIERPARYLSWFKRKELLTRIRRFRAKGGRTALVSDYPATRKLEALGASDLFEVIVASGEPFGPKRLKPDPSGYLTAASKLGVEPARCLVLGDRQDADGLAAQAAGMTFRKIP